MEADIIKGLVGAIPGGGIAAIAIWFAIKKDSQCTMLMQQMVELAKAQAVGTAEVKSALDAIREAIRIGTRS